MNVGLDQSSHTSSQKLTSKHAVQLMNCGFTSGLLQAFIFNPWDRALYLSVKYERPFLRMDNFQNPMAGVFQTVLQRAISAGLYFPLEELSVELLEAITGNYNSLTIFTAGTLAGVANGVIMNPFTRVKVSIFFFVVLPNNKLNRIASPFVIVSLLGKS